MNLYLCYTDHGNVYAVKAHYSFDACNKVEAAMKERVTAWDISIGQLPPACKVVESLCK